MELILLIVGPIIDPQKNNIYILLVFFRSRNFFFVNLTDDCTESDSYNGGKQVKFTNVLHYTCVVFVWFLNVEWASIRREKCNDPLFDLHVYVR